MSAASFARLDPHSKNRQALAGDGVPASMCIRCGFKHSPGLDCITVLRDRIALLESRSSLSPTASSIKTVNKKDIIREHFSAIGKKGGPAGGKARMASITPDQRTELATKAAAARWKKKPKGE